MIFIISDMKGVMDLSILQETAKDVKTLEQELQQLQFQMYRMQENMKDISKKAKIIGIDQAKEDEWMIVSAIESADTCKIMLSDCEKAFRGQSDFSLIAEYPEEGKIHIADIKGPPDNGYGSICMKHLKEIAREQNIPVITGDLVKRDWNHVDRLIHFYEKHQFDVQINWKEQSGEIYWVDS